MDLGVELGLSYFTLQAIEMERCMRLNDCRRDMFVAWLQMRDKVSTVGEPSWSVLRAALRRMGEKGLANKILVSCESMYYNVVHDNRDVSHEGVVFLIQKEEEEEEPSKKCVIM